MSDNKKVLFFSPYAIWYIHSQVDAVVATALRERGCQVLVVGCDGLYHNCHITWSDSTQKMCQNCAQTSKAYFEGLFKLPHIQLRNFIEIDDYNLANQWVETVNSEDYANAVYHNIPIGKWVTSTIYTYFRLSARGLSRPHVRKVHKQYLIEGVVTYNALSRLFAKYQPTNLFIFNGRFAPYRIAFEVARQHKIDVITHERGWIDDSFAFFDNCTVQSTKPPLDCVKAWENIPLTNEELIQTKKYFTAREYGLDMNWPSFYNFKTNYADVRHQLRIPLDAKIVTVFTSSEDELAALEDRVRITEQFNIIERLIEIFKNRNEYLVIRHHPYIKGSTSSLVETDSLLNAYNQTLSVRKNVRIVMPSERLTSYALLWQTDAAIAFFSTVAIESIARGVPTATLATSPYEKACRYAIQDSSTEHLSHIVDSLLVDSAKPTEEDLKRLYRFTNAYFYKFSKKFSLIGIKDFYRPDLKFNSLNDLQPGVDPVLDQVCNRILLGSSLVDQPISTQSNRSSEQEDAFYKQELKEIQAHKKLVQEQTLQNDNLALSPLVAVISLNYKGVIDNSQLLANSLRTSRSENFVIHNVNDFEIEDYENIIDFLLKFTDNLREDYVLVTNSYTQYDESFLSSAIDILTSNEFQAINGIVSGAWLSSSDHSIEDGLFLSGIFNKKGEFIFRKGDTTYQQAVELLPLIGYPPTILAFSLIRKSWLREILENVRQLPTINMVAEKLFDYILKEPSIHRNESPQLVIRQELEVFQALVKQIKKDTVNSQVEVTKNADSGKLNQSVPMIESVPDGESRPFWSVMIITQNGAKYLREILESILEQDPRSEQMQIEVVDDSTKDDIEAVVREIGKGRVSLFKRSPGGSLTDNLNTCLQRAKGNWVHILHGCSTVLPGFYSRLQQGIEKEPTTGAAFSRCILLDENGNSKALSPLEIDTPGIVSNILPRLVVSNRVLTHCIVVKRDVYEKLGGFNHELSQAADWEMWKRIAANYPIWFETQPLACYSEHFSSDTARLIQSGENIIDMHRAINITESYLPQTIAAPLSNQAREFYGLQALNTARQMLAMGDMNAAVNQIKAGLKCSNSSKVINLLATILTESEPLLRLVSSLLISMKTANSDS